MHRVPYWRLSAYYFTYFTFLGVFSPYFGLYLQSLSFSAWEIGLVMSQMQLMRVFAPYLWGIVADRIGQRLLIVRLTGLVALIVFLTFFHFTRIESLLLPMAVFSFFWAASLPLVEALTFDHLRESPERYSRIRLWGSAGFIVAALCAGALLDLLPLASVLWSSVVTLIAIVLFSALVPEVAAHPRAEVAQPIREILQEARVRALLAACFAMSAAHGVLNVFYSIFLSEHGYSKSVVGGLFGLGVVAEIAVFYVMSRVMRRFSLRRILLASFSAAVLRFVMIGWGADRIEVLIFTQLLHGLTFGACHAAAISAVNRWFPGNTHARGQALYASVSFGAGGLTGGLLAGWCWDSIGGELSFAVSSLYALIGLFLVARWVRESDVGEPDDISVVDTSDCV